MQLDDVISSTTPDPQRVEDAMLRSIRRVIRIRNPLRWLSCFDILMPWVSHFTEETEGRCDVPLHHALFRWLDRCIVAHRAPQHQALFGIVQGGLDLRLRERALALVNRRACHGAAIGGLSGGERKSDFWQVVHLVSMMTLWLRSKVNQRHDQNALNYLVCMQSLANLLAK